MNKQPKKTHTKKINQKSPTKPRRNKTHQADLRANLTSVFQFLNQADKNIKSSLTGDNECNQAISRELCFWINANYMIRSYLSLSSLYSEQM